MNSFKGGVSIMWGVEQYSLRVSVIQVKDLTSNKLGIFPLPPPAGDTDVSRRGTIE
jgi:hypothetical protein